VEVHNMSFKSSSWIVAHHDFSNNVLRLSSSNPVSRSASSKAMPKFYSSISLIRKSSGVGS
jgi:hypothetical protein